MANDTEDSFDRAMHSAFDAGVQLDQLSLDGELDEEARREASRLVERARVSLAQGELEHSLDALSSAWSRYPLPILVDEIACDPAFTPLRGAARFRLFEAASLTAQARQTDDVAAAFALVERATALAPEYVPAYEYWESLARRIPDALEAARATRARLRIPMQSAQALCFWLLRTLHDEAALPELIVARLAERHADSPVAHFHRALWMAHVGDHVGARAALWRVVDMQPEADGAWLREELADHEEFDALVDSPAFGELMARVEDARPTRA